MDINKFLKKYKYYLIMLLIITIVFSYFVIFYDGYFVFLADMLDQQTKFYIDLWLSIRKGTLSLWDWSNFLGANYYGANTYFFLGSPFVWLTMALPKVEWILPFFLIANYLKSFLCSIFTFWWLRKVTKNEFASICGAIAFTFCSFVLINYPNSFYFDVILFLPLCLYFVEVYLSSHKYYGVIFSIAIVGICNYYFLYLFTPFLFLYTLFRYVVLQEKVKAKQIILDGLKFLLLYVVAIFLCSFVLIPSFLALQNNPRSSEFVIGFNTIGKGNIIRFLTAFINPVNDWRENINYYVNNKVVEGISWGGGMPLYTFMLTPFLMYILLFLKNNKEKLSLILLYILYFIFALFPMFYVLFNQNYETRWMINIVLINVLMISTIIARRDEVNKRQYFISTSLISLFILVSLFITWSFNLSPEIWGWKIICRNAVISIILLILYSFLFIKSKKAFQIGMVCMLIGEIGFSYYNVFENDGWYLSPLTKKEIENYDLYEGKEIIDYIKSQDSDFYRIDIDSLRFISMNDATLLDYHSFNNYHSVYNYNSAEFIKNRFAKAGASAIAIHPQKGKFQLKNLLASKYWFSYAGREVKLGGSNRLNYTDYPPFGYEYYATVDNIQIYKNKYFIPLIYVEDNELSYDSFIELSIFDQDRVLNNYVVVNGSDNKKVEYPDSLTLVKKYDESINDITFEGKEGYIYIVFKNPEGIDYKSTFTFYDKHNQVIREFVSNSIVGYLGMELPKGTHHIKTNIYDMYEIYYDDLIWYDEWYENKNLESMKNIQCDKNEVSATITMEDGGWIVTSIPYDDGWKITVNGNVVPYEKINTGFIGIYLEKGQYNLHFSYFPPGLKLGMIISVSTSIIVLVLFFIVQNKQRRKNNNDLYL